MNKRTVNLIGAIFIFIFQITIISLAIYSGISDKDLFVSDTVAVVVFTLVGIVSLALRYYMLDKESE